MLHRTAVGSFPTDDGGYEATPQFLYPGAWAAAGTTLITTTEDTVRFLRMHLDGGMTAEGRRILTPGSAAAMQTPTIHEPTGPSRGFGLGWHYEEQHGRRLLSHGGGSIGGVCEAVVSPSDNLVSITFVNSILGGPVLDDLRVVLTPWSAPPPEAEPSPDVDHAPFVGTYLRRGDRLDVVPSGDGLLVRTTPIVEDQYHCLVPYTSRSARSRGGSDRHVRAHRSGGRDGRGRDEDDVPRTRSARLRAALLGPAPCAPVDRVWSVGFARRSRRRCLKHRAKVASPRRRQ